MMKKRLAALLAAAVLLCGCMPHRRIQTLPAMPYVEEQPDPTPLPTPEPDPVSEDALYGSVRLLDEPTVLVSVYLNDAATGSIWTADAREEARQQVAMAVDWITAEAGRYGVTAELYYDDGGTDSPLCHTYSVRSRLQGGAPSMESDDFLNEMDAVCATLDTDDLRARYGTDRVGFLIFLPVSGTSFTMAHYADDGEDFFYEYSCLYRFDAYSDTAEPESPATYAHEILHLFGAPDYYAESGDFFVDEELTAYMENNHPDEIMLSTYTAEGENLYTAIEKELGTLTAYCVGLTDTCPELQLFPQLAAVEPGIFRYEAAPGPQDWIGDGSVAV